tara:strand:- start:23877 stop:24065 length:189 start_codon:yes stop_codon:yes gene_type:complete
MSESFGKLEFDLPVKTDEVKNLLKKYKKIKKYMRSSLFAVKTMDETETLVSNLLKESEQDTI